MGAMERFPPLAALALVAAFLPAGRPIPRDGPVGPVPFLPGGALATEGALFFLTLTVVEALMEVMAARRLL